MDIQFTGAAVDCLDRLDAMVKKALYEKAREVAASSSERKVTPEHIRRALNKIDLSRLAAELS